jgi:hypothetical protein
MSSAWTKYWIYQIQAFVLMVLGWVLLAPLCLVRAWRPTYSHKHPYINVWRNDTIDAIWGNEEDGVTGDDFYLPTTDWRIRAYLWSAWRNSVNNFNRRNAVLGGPFLRIIRGQWLFQVGYRPDNGWPVFRLKRVS